MTSRIPDYVTPFVDSSGRPTEMWWRFFLNLSDSINAITGGGGDGASIAVENNVSGAVASLAQRLDYIEKMASLKPVNIPSSDAEVLGALKHGFQ